MARTRDFYPSDQDRVRSLVLGGLGERWGGSFESGHNPDLDDIGRSYIARGGEVTVVESDGDVVAVGILVPESRRRGRIVRMSVATEVRRQGFGRVVVEDLLGRARRRGMSEVVVLTDSRWFSAVSLYLACGFEEVGRDDEDTHLRTRL